MTIRARDYESHSDLALVRELISECWRLAGPLVCGLSEARISSSVAPLIGAAFASRSGAQRLYEGPGFGLLGTHVDYRREAGRAVRR